MSTIDLVRYHRLGLKAARQKTDELAREVGLRCEPWYNIGEQDDLGLACRFVGQGNAKGTIELHDASVRIQIDLPFFLRPMKATVEAKINAKLDEILA